MAEVLSHHQPISAIPFEDVLYGQEVATKYNNPVGKQLPSSGVMHRLYTFAELCDSARSYPVHDRLIGERAFRFDRISYTVFLVLDQPHLVVFEGYERLDNDSKKLFATSVRRDLLDVSRQEKEMSKLFPTLSFDNRNKAAYLRMVNAHPDRASRFSLVSYREEGLSKLLGLRSVSYETAKGPYYALHGLGLSIFSPNIDHLRALTRQILANPEDAYAAVYIRRHFDQH